MIKYALSLTSLALLCFLAFTQSVRADDDGMQKSIEQIALNLRSFSNSNRDVKARYEASVLADIEILRTSIPQTNQTRVSRIATLAFALDQSTTRAVQNAAARVFVDITATEHDRVTQQTIFERLSRLKTSSVTHPPTEALLDIQRAIQQMTPANDEMRTLQRRFLQATDRWVRERTTPFPTGTQNDLLARLDQDNGTEAAIVRIDAELRGFARLDAAGKAKYESSILKDVAVLRSIQPRGTKSKEARIATLLLALGEGTTPAIQNSAADVFVDISAKEQDLVTQEAVFEQLSRLKNSNHAIHPPTKALVTLQKAITQMKPQNETIQMRQRNFLQANVRWLQGRAPIGAISCESVFIPRIF